MKFHILRRPVDKDGERGLTGPRGGAGQGQEAPKGLPISDVAPGGINLHTQTINTSTTRPRNDEKSLTLDLVGKKEDATTDHQPQATPLTDVSGGPLPWPGKTTTSTQAGRR